MIDLPMLLTLLQPVEFPSKLGICDRLFGSAIARHGVGWVKTGAGIPWKLDLNNPTHRWIVYGKYEGNVFLDWAKGFLPADAVIVDSGANIGQMLIYLAQWVPRGRVLAFEPGREQAEWLRECLRVHKRLPVELIQCGLGDTAFEARLQNNSPESVHGAQSEVSLIDGRPIRIVRLADELKSRAITKVDLWKLDVEGYEIPALRGAEEFLKERRIKAIYAELAGDNGERIREYLSGFGYVCHLFDRRETLQAAIELPAHTNGLFLPVSHDGRKAWR